MSQYFHLLTLIIILFISNSNVYSQLSSSESLTFYADVLTNASSLENRIHANEKFIEELDQTLSLKESFKNSLESLPWIFVRYAPSREFRFISWQLELDKKQFQYFTYFQSETGKVIKISDDNQTLELRETYSATNGYAAIIHQIIPFDNYYLLASYRQKPNGISQKICEVLDVKNGEPSFGKSLFYESADVPNGRGKKRVIMTYSSVASASMNINLNDIEKVIVFDHIISVPGKTSKEGMIQVPDGSFEAYVQNGPDKWLYNPNLYEGLEYNPKTQSKPTNRKNTVKNSKKPR